MKQNSSILFHDMRKSLKNSYLHNCKTAAAIVIFCVLGSFCASLVAADKPEYLASFDPAKGFKPAQSDLTEVFLQIAGSLEYYGSPEPYLRHMKAEHERIEAKYQKQTGDKPRSFCPSYMDAAYFDRFAANWKHMAPPLGLEALAKSVGRLMRAAISGPEGKGTILADVFNEHQRQVHAAMTGKKAAQIPDFDVLKANMAECLRFNEPPSPTAGLTADQRSAAQPVNEIRAAFLKLFSALDAGLPATDAQKVKTVLLGIITDAGRMAQSELEAAMVEDSLDELHSPKPPYSAEQETALTAEEQNIFAGFLKKRRFTRADFPALERFYKGPYDRLSGRGKDEMSARIDAGMQPRQR